MAMIRVGMVGRVRVIRHGRVPSHPLDWEVLSFHGPQEYPVLAESSKEEMCSFLLETRVMSYGRKWYSKTAEAKYDFLFLYSRLQLEVKDWKLEDSAVFKLELSKLKKPIESFLADKVHEHRPGQESPLADLLVFENHPEEIRDQVAKLCDTLYSTGKCQIVQGQIRAPRDDTAARYRRQAETTTANPKPVRASDVLPVMPYPAAFQLLFWVTLAIFLTVYGVAWGMWNMDPGRDSIIYRMTSAQKYKKDK